MSGIRFTDEFKRDAVAQVVERGYSVSEVSERLGISTKSLYTSNTQFFFAAAQTDDREHRESRISQRYMARLRHPLI